jgi:Na+/H+ antiporter NhaA
VQGVLLLFAFANAVVPLAQIGPDAYYVLVALLLGKPMGILLFSRVAVLAGARLLRDLRTADVLIFGIAASIGFTVSSFFATAAFSEGRALAETKMGALLSFVAAPLALAASRVLRGRVRKPRYDITSTGVDRGRRSNWTDARVPREMFRAVRACDREAFEALRASQSH